MTVALVPGMAAREAAVSSLGLIYSLGEVDETSEALHTLLRRLMRAFPDSMRHHAKPKSHDAGTNDAED